MGDAGMGTGQGRDDAREGGEGGEAEAARGASRVADLYGSRRRQGQGLRADQETPPELDRTGAAGSPRKDDNNDVARP